MQKILRPPRFDVSRSDREWFKRLFKPYFLRLVDIGRLVPRPSFFEQAQADNNKAIMSSAGKILITSSLNIPLLLIF